MTSNGSPISAPPVTSLLEIHVVLFVMRFLRPKGPLKGLLDDIGWDEADMKRLKFIKHFKTAHYQPANRNRVRRSCAKILAKSLECDIVTRVTWFCFLVMQD